MAQTQNFCAVKMNILLPAAGCCVLIDEPDAQILSLQGDKGAAFQRAASGAGEGTGVQDEPGPIGRQVRHMGVAVEDHVRPDLLPSVAKGQGGIELMAVGQQKPLAAQIHDLFRRRIGPKVAISVLSSMTPSDVRAAIVTDNPAAFDRVVGMGRKTAQRVILELGESIRQENVGTAPVKAADTKPSLPSLQSEAVAALTSLGYDGLTASRAVAKIKEADSVEELITKALRSMAKG